MAKKAPNASKAKKTTDPFTIVKKRSGRYAVLQENGKYLNGAEKVKVLVDKGLIKQNKPKAAPATAEAPAAQ